jgi:hypothetical protein
MWKLSIFDPPGSIKRTKAVATKAVSTSTIATRSNTLRRIVPGEKRRADFKNSVSPDNIHNPGNLLYTCPEYGYCFQKETTRVKRLDYQKEHDIREFFLSDIERKVMLATLKFSTNYVLGFIDSKDIRKASKDDQFKYKTKEHLVEAICTVCNYKFSDNTRLWHLSVWVRRDKKKFDFCCKDCSVAAEDCLNMYDIYPRLSLNDLHHLNREGFFSRYIFPMDVGYYSIIQQKRVEITDHHGDVFKIIQRLLLEHKLPEQHIFSITLSNMSHRVLVEEYKRIELQRYRCMIEKPQTRDDVNCFIVDNGSEMLDAVKNNTFKSIKGTVFAIIKYRTHKSVFAGVLTFPLKFSKNEYCQLCKKLKMYYKNPVLYCTKCGFTNRNQFIDKGTKNFSDCLFETDFIKSRELNDEMILYYDMDAYNNYIKKQKLYYLFNFSQLLPFSNLLYMQI